MAKAFPPSPPVAPVLLKKWGGLLALALLTLVLPAAAADERSAILNLPDVELVDQDGVARRLLPDLIQGHIALVSFVFTGCTTICSPVGANMGALDHLLGDRTKHEVSLLSVTLDPFNDTPDELKKWRAQFDDAPGWRILTGEPRAVEAVLHAMQADPADISTHDAFLWLGDPRTGTWRRVSSLAAPAALAALVDQLAARS
jgi:protein SCO1/2